MTVASISEPRARNARIGHGTCSTTCPVLGSEYHLLTEFFRLGTLRDNHNDLFEYMRDRHQHIY